jgi:hypothetical protein
VARCPLLQMWTNDVTGKTNLTDSLGPRAGGRVVGPASLALPLQQVILVAAQMQRPGSAVP